MTTRPAPAKPEPAPLSDYSEADAYARVMCSLGLKMRPVKEFS